MPDVRNSCFKEDIMLHRPIWTERRLTGMTFLLGALLFFVGDALPVSDASKERHFPGRMFA